MSTLRIWLSELDLVILFFSVFIAFWFVAIIYCIPVRLYFDEKALEAERRSAVLQAKAEVHQVVETQSLRIPSQNNTRNQGISSGTFTQPQSFDSRRTFHQRVPKTYKENGGITPS